MIAEIVRHNGNGFVIYLEDKDVKNKIAEWVGCQIDAPYFKQGKVIGWHVTVPKKLYNHVAKLTGLPVKAKNPNRVKQGLIMAERNRQHQFKG